MFVVQSVYTTGKPSPVCTLTVDLKPRYMGRALSGRKCVRKQLQNMEVIKKNVRRQQESRKGRIVLMRAVTVNVFYVL